MIKRSGKHCASRHRLRRVVALVLFAVFANRTLGDAWVRCDLGDVSPATSPMTEMSHDHHAAESPRAPAAPHAADPPAPQGSPCGHPVSAGDCGLGTGCIAAVYGTVIVIATLDPGLQGDYAALANGPRALEFAPDTPPPRA